MKATNNHNDTGNMAGMELIRTGLFGRGILASRSPWMHEQEAKAQSLNLSYELFDFTARGWHDDDLGDHLANVESEGFSGINVTYPFKQAIIPLLDALAPSAQNVGAVNTVCFTNGRRIGHNTDMTGFADSIREELGGSPTGRVVQYGAGGAGSATAHALLSLGATQLTLVDVDETRGQQLAGQLLAGHPDTHIAACHPDQVSFSAIDGVVNATPFGMASHPGTPFDPAMLSANCWVADVVYFPVETALLRAAKAMGCRTISGKGMAAYQAADAFTLFTQKSANRDRFLAAFEQFPSPS
jgi:shikimate dehydrogenase